MRDNRIQGEGKFVKLWHLTTSSGKQKKGAKLPGTSRGSSISSKKKSGTKPSGFEQKNRKQKLIFTERGVRREWKSELKRKKRCRIGEGADREKTHTSGGARTAPHKVDG